MSILIYYTSYKVLLLLKLKKKSLGIISVSNLVKGPGDEPLYSKTFILRKPVLKVWKTETLLIVFIALKLFYRTAKHELGDNYII